MEDHPFGKMEMVSHIFSFIISKVEPTCEADLVLNL